MEQKPTSYPPLVSQDASNNVLYCRKIFVISLKLVMLIKNSITEKRFQGIIKKIKYLTKEDGIEMKEKE